MKKIDILVKDFKEQNLVLPIWFENEKVKIVDQLKLPFKEEVYDIDNVKDVGKAIKDMNIRGSGAIGIAGAYGLYLSALKSNGNINTLLEDGTYLISTRTTAVNLAKTVNEIIDYALKNKEKVLEAVEEKVCEILKRQLEFEHKLGEYGANLIEDGDTILTHCHSGAMAGSGYGGRALSVIRKAFEQGKKIHVYTSETRPYLQGARITAYELRKFNIPYTLITDNMSGYFMRAGKIQKVVVGSDRIAANGDLANKIGTYMHASLAKIHEIPFYTATSSHTIDLKTKCGDDIKIEFRDSQEVLKMSGKYITLEDTNSIYPSFDITPNNLISGIITEKGVIKPSYKENLMRLLTDNTLEKGGKL